MEHSNGVTWLPGVGVRLNDKESVVQYRLQQPCVDCEMSAYMTNLGNGKWRYKVTLTRYVKPSSTTGAADGTGTLFRWDAATAAWVVNSTLMSTITFFTDFTPGQYFSAIGTKVRSTNSAWSSAWFMIQTIWSGKSRGFSVW